MIFFGFGGFILVLAIFRSIRRMRQIRERAEQSRGWTIDRRRKPSDDFRDQIWQPLCDQVAAITSQRLNRPLTEKERRMIWRTRSELTLNVVLGEIEQTADPQQVAVLIASLPPGMDRPDPAGWCEPKE